MASSSITKDPQFDWAIKLHTAIKQAIDPGYPHGLIEQIYHTTFLEIDGIPPWQEAHGEHTIFITEPFHAPVVVRVTGPMNQLSIEVAEYPDLRTNPPTA